MHLTAATVRHHEKPRDILAATGTEKERKEIP